MGVKTWIAGAVALTIMVVGPEPAHGDPTPVDAGTPAPQVAAEPAADPADPIDALMARFNAMPGLYARFTESKTIGLLAVPLVNHGTLHYHPPGRLLRTIDAPHASQVLLLSDAIWLREGAAAPERVDLGSHPAVQSFVGSFRSLLAGDRKALDAHFELSLAQGAADRWTLTLRPRSKAMARIVTKMTVSGDGETVERLVIEESTGDVSDTHFADVDPTRRYSDDEAARLFAPPA